MAKALTQKIFFLLLAFLAFQSNCKADCEQRSLFEDLSIVESINRRLCYRVPLHYNHLLMAGYINMPSARIGLEGELGAGFAYVAPYHIYSARAELNHWIEVSANYRVFKGVDDPVLTPLGFGDMSDKGANIKFAILHPEDSDYLLPGIAVGLEDFLGTRSFEARYIALTQVFPKQAMEFTLGYGCKRIRGVFGGFSWMPFRDHDSIFPLFLVAEYDAIPYKDKHIEPHPEGRVRKTPFNFGLKWRLFNSFDLTASYVRGDAFAFSLSTFYNFGETKGFVPKVEDPLPYRAPAIYEPLSELRPENVFAQDLAYALKSQGFKLLKASLTYYPCNGLTLRLNLVNIDYRKEEEVRRRLSYLLGSLVPNGIDAVSVAVEGDWDGFAAQEYYFPSAWLKLFHQGAMGFYELKIHSPLLNYHSIPPLEETVIFKAPRTLFCFDILPDFHSFFGSARGKFKYALGIAPGIEGFLTGDVYYTARVGFLFVSDIDDIRDVDRLNPSQLLNVRSDIINYYKQRGLTFQELYFRKIWNLNNGFFSKLSWGFLERMYGGVAGELLYYPVNSCFAAGIEGAVVRKRTTTGFGFEKRIRRLKGFTPTYVPFVGSQAFFNLYYDWKGAELEFRLKAGQFLARDVGIRYEVSRYFESGLRVTLWYTRTNGHDVINNSTYYDKGAMISMPLDIFYTHSCRQKFYYGMSAWLRDVGQFACTGGNLYDLINDLRQY